MRASPLKDRPLGQEEALAKSLLELTQPEKIELFSDLNDEEIIALSALLTWGKELKIKVLKTFVQQFLRLRVSRYRLGRREIALTVGMAGGSVGVKPKSVKDLFAGLKI